MQQRSVQHQSVYPPAPHQRRARRANRKGWFSTQSLLIALGLGASFVFASLGALFLGITLIYAQGILPGVRALGVELGGMTTEEAVSALSNQWAAMTVRDEDRVWVVNATTLGLNLDAEATAKAAYAQGRAEGSFGSALLGRIDVELVFTIDTQMAEQGLTQLAPEVAIMPVNAGVQFVNGQAQPTAAQTGRVLDIAATVAQLQNGTAFHPDGTLHLVTSLVQPTVTDASPMIAQAQQLLSSAYTFNVFDPVTGDLVQWSAPSQTWAAWLAAAPDANSPTGLTFNLDTAQVSAYLQTQAAAILDNSRYLNLEEAAAAAQAAIGSSSPQSYVRVYHHDRLHTVQAGETITSIAWDYGVPYLYIQQANGGIGSVSVGQTITIPSPDNFFDFAPIPNKRIVVSISQQHLWVYENGILQWDAVISTGIASSPTWPGLYQVISHEPNAYAGNWDLYMPNFMGIYRPIPGADFTNGFHGFPTRGGSQLLWTNNLGTRVTYGCVLLGDTAIQNLYNWAENGVVVEIQP
jgi:lipoprotein-anchoring transpeptidase ErfK/SrfK